MGVSTRAVREGRAVLAPGSAIPDETDLNANDDAPKQR